MNATLSRFRTSNACQPSGATSPPRNSRQPSGATSPFRNSCQPSSTTSPLRIGSRDRSRSPDLPTPSRPSPAVPATPTRRHSVAEQHSQLSHHHRHDLRLLDSPHTQRRLKDRAARVCQDCELQPEALDDFIQVTCFKLIILYTLIFS